MSGFGTLDDILLFSAYIFMTVVRITYDLQVCMLNYMFRYARFLTLVMEYSLLS